MFNIKNMYRHYKHLLNLREEYKYCKWNGATFHWYLHIREYYENKALDLADEYNHGKFWWMKRIGGIN